MIALLTGVFTASLLGSVHCAGMCGPLAVVAASPVQLTAGGRPIPPRERTPHTTRWWRSLAAEGSLRLSGIYHLARLSTYAALGAIAGAVGHAVNLSGSAVGLERAAVVLAASTLLIMGLVMLARELGLRLPASALPARLTAPLKTLHARAARTGPAARAAIIGLATALLPCGWLYAFIISAAGTAHPISGALVMLAFWAGTVPILTLVGVGAHRALRPLRRHIPALTATLLILSGSAALVWRASPVLATPTATSAGAPPACPLCEMHQAKKTAP